MSTVLSYTTKRKAIIAGDSRVYDPIHKKTLQENYKKTMKINEKVIIGFTGDRDQCDKLAKMISSDIDSASFIDDVILYIENFISKISEETYVGIAICGIDKKRKMCSGVISTSKETSILYPPENKCCFFVLPPNGAPNDDSIFKEKLLELCPIDAMKATIEYYSEKYPSVNNKITFEQINFSE